MNVILLALLLVVSYPPASQYAFAIAIANVNNGAERAGLESTAETLAIY